MFFAEHTFLLLQFLPKLTNIGIRVYHCIGFALLAGALELKVYTPWLTFVCLRSSLRPQPVWICFLCCAELLLADSRNQTNQIALCALTCYISCAFSSRNTEQRANENHLDLSVFVSVTCPAPTASVLRFGTWASPLSLFCLYYTRVSPVCLLTKCMYF